MNQTVVDSALSADRTNLAIGGLALLLILIGGYVMVQRRRVRLAATRPSDFNPAAADGEARIVGIPFEWFPIVIGGLLLAIALLKLPTAPPEAIEEWQTGAGDVELSITGDMIENRSIERVIGSAAAVDWSTSFNDGLRELDAKIQRLASLADSAQRSDQSAELPSRVRDLSFTATSTSVEIWRDWFVLEADVHAMAAEWDAAGRTEESARLKTQLAKVKTELLSYLDQAVDPRGHAGDGDPGPLGRSLPRVGAGSTAALNQSLKSLDEILRRIEVQ